MLPQCIWECRSNYTKHISSFWTTNTVLSSTGALEIVEGSASMQLNTMHHKIPHNSIKFYEILCNTTTIPKVNPKLTPTILQKPCMTFKVISNLGDSPNAIGGPKTQ